ncbi:AraC family transcriptional regulator [Sphingobacterium sp. SRCM116780]|uniref:helix-turn-helix domain-containing protein n=1 Tax=Sphingobacterium sp. SRCM116780 TaxID=2907623 RepID=UPI001F1C1F82|nr:AraC family transcriptional regulator [Sphingobacterium sp. SRCM116780]UIR57815.1 AraC family transcriptional regulator [Sphingobacterium sp. SRCM116780]
MENFLNLYFTLFFLFLCELVFAQKEEYSDYYKLQKKYENRPENDSTVLPLVAKYIQKAKKEKNYQKLVLGYKDGLVFSPDPADKLKYADSVVCAALLTKDHEMISNAFMNKGVVYYFNLKKYKLALTEYLKAYEYCKDSKDQYHKNRLRYLIGVVKSYIGYYDEALAEFKNTRSFFESEIKKDLHSNLIYSNRRGYFNSLHQMAVCYRNLGQLKTADSIVYIGLSATLVNREYNQEHGYFLKERGISEYFREEYDRSIKTLESSLKEIADVDDFAWTTVCYSYIGKSYKKLGEINHAITYFQKVDSINEKYDFILPEVRNNYVLLIDYYKKQRNTDKELYYTKRLLLADSLIAKDFIVLSSRIHKEYDTRSLQEDKSKLERNSSRHGYFIALLIMLAIALLIVLLVRYRIEKKIRQNYNQLEQKILNKENSRGNKVVVIKQSDKVEIEGKIVTDIIMKLEEFEIARGFLQSGLTINRLASTFDTNRNYLSQVINDYRGMNFNRYLSELRIGFITEKLYTDKKYLNYKIETLAEECGIASRSNFSNLFREINGIRPVDFIKKRQEDNRSDYT